MTQALIALGSNEGERLTFLRSAIEALGGTPGVVVRAVSSFHRTAPVGGPAGQAHYLNGAAVIDTSLAPQALLAALQAVEQQLGRVRRERWGPRTIDLDLVLYGEQTCNAAGLVVPHPHLAERRFVLAPAAEIAADWRHPVLQQTIAELLARLPPPPAEQHTLRVYTDPGALQRAVLALRRQGQRVGLVPTMGALHAGHVSLVHLARQHAELAATTIFVNPTQFAPHEDLARYPRTIEADLEALAAARCDLVLVPAAEDIYPPGFSTFVEPPAVAGPLEGVCRPGHFRGVATVVLKLFHLVPADVACFGEKDFQQLRVIQQMVRDLAIPIEIVPGPTVREPDGLAMSSRNRYLSPAERQQALALSRGLARARELVAAGERDGAAVAAALHEMLVAAGITRIDYAVVADPQTLAPLAVLDRPARALVAAWVGSTRLIDNGELVSGEW